MSSLYFSGIKRLQITRNKPAKCEKCYGAGVVHIPGADYAPKCDSCNGTGILPQNEELIRHNEQDLITVAISDNNKRLKIFLDERQDTSWQTL